MVHVAPPANQVTNQGLCSALLHQCLDACMLVLRPYQLQVWPLRRQVVRLIPSILEGESGTCTGSSNYAASRRCARFCVDHLKAPMARSTGPHCGAPSLLLFWLVRPSKLADFPELPQTLPTYDEVSLLFLTFQSNVN